MRKFFNPNYRELKKILKKCSKKGKSEFIYSEISMILSLTHGVFRNLLRSICYEGGGLGGGSGSKDDG